MPIYNEILFEVLWASELARNFSIFLIKNTFEFQPRFVSVSIADIDFDFDFLADRDRELVGLFTFLETPEPYDLCLIFVNWTFKEVFFAIRLICFDELDFTVVIDKSTRTFELID